MVEICTQFPYVAIHISSDIAVLMLCILTIVFVCRSLCEELNSCHLDATCIARCFVNNTTGFAVYTSYCTGYPRTMKQLAALASKTHSAREFRERQMALGHPLPLASYLLKPVQRILKYHLLLQVCQYFVTLIFDCLWSNADHSLGTSFIIQMTIGIEGSLIYLFNFYFIVSVINKLVLV